MAPKKNKKTTRTGIIHGGDKPKKTSTLLADLLKESASTENPLEMESEAKEEDFDIANAPGSMKMLYGLQDFLEEHLTFNKFVQVFALAYTLNILIIKKYDFIFENYYMIGFNLFGVFIGSFIAYYSSNKRFREGKRTTPPSLPEFDFIYATTLPLCLSIILKPSSLVMNLAYNYSILDIHWLPKFLVPLSFMQSYGDDLLPHQALKVSSHYGSTYLLKYLSVDENGRKSLNKTEIQLISVLLQNLLFGLDADSSTSLWILQKLIITVIGITALNIPIYQLYKALNKNKLLAIFMYFESIAAFYYGVTYQLYPILNEYPITWLQQFIFGDESRVYILKIWLASLAVLIPLTFNLSNRLSLNTRRKIWHYSIFAILIKPLSEDYTFIQIALSGMISVFLIVELLRGSNFTFLGSWLNGLLINFQDHRDKNGPLVLSYIFLISGIALPILLNDKPIASSYVGLISLGLGDSIASTFGKRFGTHKWRGVDKTFEGTIAFITATCACFGVLKEMGIVTDKSYEGIIITCFMGGVMEGVADLNDNFLVPCFMFVLLECF